LAQAELVRRGDVTPVEVAPVELVESAIDRIEALNPELNAVVTPTFDRAPDRHRTSV
jgi:amidase